MAKAKEDKINPSHYQNFIDEYQWIEAMQLIPEFKNSPEEFEAAIKLQVWKYLSRDGRKDESVQELKKALWYLELLIARKIKKGPVMVKDIKEIIS